MKAIQVLKRVGKLRLKELPALEGISDRFYFSIDKI